MCVSLLYRQICCGGISSSPLGHWRIFCTINPLTSADTITTFAVHLAVWMRQWLCTSASLAALPPPCIEDYGVWSKWENGQEGCLEFSSKMLYFNSLPKPHGSRAKDGHEFRRLQLSLALFVFHRVTINLSILAASRVRCLGRSGLPRNVGSFFHTPATEAARNNLWHHIRQHFTQPATSFRLISSF